MILKAVPIQYGLIEIAKWDRQLDLSQSEVFPVSYFNSKLTHKFTQSLIVHFASAVETF